jgi:hypothetical protein
MPLNHHSDLEAIPRAHDPATQKYMYEYGSELIPTYANRDSHSEKIAQEPLVHEVARPATVCGLRKRTFWIVCIIAMIVAAAAIAGGVGGVLAARSPARSDSAASQTPTSSRASAPVAESSTAGAAAAAHPQSSALSPSPIATPTSTTPSVTRTPIVGPTSTILRDCPSANNTVYSILTGSSTMRFRKLCSNTFLGVRGVPNAVNTVVASLDDCIDLCAAYNLTNRTRIAAGTDSVCNAVCWRNTFDKSNDWEGGRCFGFLTQNATSDGETVFKAKAPAEERCDSAALMGSEW